MLPRGFECGGVTLRMGCRGQKLARVHVGRKPLVAAAAGVPEPRGLVMPDSPAAAPFCFERFQREGKS